MQLCCAFIVMRQVRNKCLSAAETGPWRCFGPSLMGHETSQHHWPQPQWTQHMFAICICLIEYICSLMDHKSHRLTVCLHRTSASDRHTIQLHPARCSQNTLCLLHRAHSARLKAGQALRPPIQTGPVSPGNLGPDLGSWCIVQNRERTSASISSSRAQAWFM